MRKYFVKLLLQKMQNNRNIILCTGDLGYGLFDEVRNSFPNQFYNFGSSEMIMMGAACGMALENKIPFVYSITPFVVFRPLEIIRNYIDHENISVNIVGGGRNQDYGYLGFSHWANDDLIFMNNFNNIRCYRPLDEFELENNFENIVNNKKPSYLNLKK
jgi:transketolase